jgi:LPXTG-motif cell wall-anchored protein
MLAFLVFVVLAGCGEEVRIVGTRDLSLRVTPGVREVMSGEPFPLTVVRTWKKPLVPAEVDPARFAPLVLTLEQTDRREDAVRVEETLHFRAYAFARSDIVVPAQRLRAQPPEGGVERVVSAPAFRLRVATAVDDQRPGPPEMPGPPLVEARGSPWPYLLGAFLLLLGLAAFLGMRRRKSEVPAAPTQGPPPIPPGVQATRALDALRAALADGHTGEEQALLQLGAVLRRYVGAISGVPVRARTAPEMCALGATVFGGPQQIAPLARVWTAGELAKFARQPASPGVVPALIDAGLEFVRTVQPPGGGPA